MPLLDYIKSVMFTNLRINEHKFLEYYENNVLLFVLPKNTIKSLDFINDNDSKKKVIKFCYEHMCKCFYKM